MPLVCLVDRFYISSACNTDSSSVKNFCTWMKHFCDVPRLVT